MIRRLSLSLLAAALLPWTARAAHPVRNPDTFVLAPIQEVTSLDPVYAYDSVSAGLAMNIYDTLIAFDGSTNDRLTARLALEVPTLKNGGISKDGLVYKFRVRPNVKFHDGTVMTAEDVRYSILRFILTDPTGGPASLLLEPILGVASTRDAAGAVQVKWEDAEKAVRREGDTVVVRLKSPFAPFLNIMARWSYVMSRNTAKNNGEWDGTGETWQKHNGKRTEDSYFFNHANGTGPYELDRWDRQARRTYLKRNAHYWMAPAKLERVLVASVPEFGTRKLMIEAGDADLIEVPRNFVSQLAGLKGVRIADNLPRLMTDPAIFFTFHINPVGNPDIGSGKLDGDGIPPDFFTDADVRKGFSYAFDYDAFLTQTVKGVGKRPTGPVPPGLLGHHAKNKVYMHDLGRATTHLQRAWGGEVWKKGFRMTMTYNKGGEVREAACQILKANIEKLNPKFRVDLRGIEWASFVDKAQKNLMPMWSRGWTADYPDPHNFVFPFYHSAGRYASSQKFSDPEMDKMIDAAVRETDPVKRERMYWKIQERGFDLAPSILAWHQVGVYGLRTWLKGFYDNAVFMGIYDYPLYKKGDE
ncbi:MAG: ABC transporter substrate-binding protein [Elusimicrobia bacterium]|nr:ABC transporter substrate-binding protein [Elusimicrobiota bacterium]